jgi:UDP-N-acetylmuramoyl-L-alanyl-D-glutamate--2,6-diaminopimelate ligase
MAMRFSNLLAEASLDDAKSQGDAEVIDVVADSRRCRAGSCFVAVRGGAADGHGFIKAAVAAGAVAVVCQDASNVPPGVATAVVPDTRLAAARLAQAIHGWPARKLTCVAVTGTNGKSTVAHMVREILREAGFSPALLGTITYETGKRTLPASNTTPDPVVLAELMAEMVADGRTHLVMEASSHALDQHRTDGLDFRVAIFTNLTGDHLDYHGTMEAYGLAKVKLFSGLSAGAVAVINRDDPAGELMASASAAPVIWYGLSPAADLWATIDRIDASGTRFTIVSGQRRLAVRTGLIGRHNVYNCLAAAAACWRGLGLELETAVRTLENVHNVPGRLQRVDGEAPFSVFVDYAHTDDAMENVLTALRPVTAGRLIVVFGCGGDRDRTKRPRMARVAERHADQVIITSDNPRSEDPAAIIDEIRSGLTAAGSGKAVVEADRAAAIARAVEGARAGDVVLIAGKGHENYQIIGPARIHFDDVEVAAEAIRRRGLTV